MVFKFQGGVVVCVDSRATGGQANDMYMANANDKVMIRLIR